MSDNNYITIRDNMLVRVSDKYVPKDSVFVIPKGIEIICDSCFRYNNNIKIVQCPSSLKIIGRFAFEGSSIEIIHFNEGLEEIRDRAFLSSDILQINFPNSLKYLGVEALRNCRQLQKIDFGTGNYKISDHCFNGCFSIFNIVLSDNIEEIGEGSFYDCNLRQLKLGKNLKKLGESAFENNSNIDNLIFPSSLTDFYPDSFSVKYLENITFNSFDSFDLFIKNYMKEIYEISDKDQYEDYNKLNIELNINGEHSNNTLQFYIDINEKHVSKENLFKYFDNNIEKTIKNIDKFIKKIKKKCSRTDFIIDMVYLIARKDETELSIENKTEQEKLVVNNSIENIKQLTVNNTNDNSNKMLELNSIRYCLITEELINYINSFITNEELKIKNADELIRISKDLQIKILELEKIYLLNNKEKYEQEFNKLNNYCHSDDFITELISVLNIQLKSNFVPFYNMGKNNQENDISENKNINVFDDNEEKIYTLKKQ